MCQWCSLFRIDFIQSLKMAAHATDNDAVLKLHTFKEELDQFRLARDFVWSQHTMVSQELLRVQGVINQQAVLEGNVSGGFLLPKKELEVSKAHLEASFRGWLMTIYFKKKEILDAMQSINYLAEFDFDDGEASDNKAESEFDYAPVNHGNVELEFVMPVNSVDEEQSESIEQPSEDNSHGELGEQYVDQLPVADAILVDDSVALAFEVDQLELDQD